MISGTTRFILHVGCPIGRTRSPLISSPYFAQHGIDAAVATLNAPPAIYPALLQDPNLNRLFLGGGAHAAATGPGTL